MSFAWYVARVLAGWTASAQKQNREQFSLPIPQFVEIRRTRENNFLQVLFHTILEQVGGPLLSLGFSFDMAMHGSVEQFQTFSGQGKIG